MPPKHETHGPSTGQRADKASEPRASNLDKALGFLGLKARLPTYKDQEDMLPKAKVTEDEKKNK